MPGSLVQRNASADCSSSSALLRGSLPSHSRSSSSSLISRRIWRRRKASLAIPINSPAPRPFFFSSPPSSSSPSAPAFSPSIICSRKNPKNRDPKHVRRPSDPILSAGLREFSRRPAGRNQNQKNQNQKKPDIMKPSTSKTLLAGAALAGLLS